MPRPTQRFKTRRAFNMNDHRTSLTLFRMVYGGWHDAECRELWDSGADTVLVWSAEAQREIDAAPSDRRKTLMSRAGERPRCWWEWESPEPRDDDASPGGRTRQLRRMKQLSPAEERQILHDAESKRAGGVCEVTR